MLRTAAIGIVVGMVVSGAVEARPRHQIDATPFSHAPCSVLRGEPCTPSFCSVFNHGPCIPEINYPIGENLQLTVLSEPPHDEATRYQKPDHDLNTIGDLFTALRACWSPPPADAAREGMQISVLFSLKRSGVMIAPPRVTYATRDAGAELRNSYLSAIKSSLNDCLPLTFTPSLAGAIAGRPIMIRYVDNRLVKNPSSSPEVKPQRRGGYRRGSTRPLRGWVFGRLGVVAGEAAGRKTLHPAGCYHREVFGGCLPGSAEDP